jgi:hypothetical protein
MEALPSPPPVQTRLITYEMLYSICVYLFLCIPTCADPIDYLQDVV